MTPQGIPLLNFEFDMQTRSPLSPTNTDSSIPDHPNVRNFVKKWYHYVPLCVLVLLMLAPHPSWLYVLVDFHLLTMRHYFAFGIHLFITYTLTFCAFASLIILVVRDPGPVTMPKSFGDIDADDDLDITEALMRPEDYIQPGTWCRKCEAPKPERTHHCSLCGRCVLKMDHHCPWLASKCIGHRTYPAFVHFLMCITLLSLYIAVVSGLALVYAFNNPLVVNEDTPFHEVALTFAGIVFGLVVGSFLCYHLYLISTNQTTLESTTPFLLLRHLPPLPRGNHALSSPPVEAELSYRQRRLVKDAHRHIRPYDLGWWKNWSQVFGWRNKHHLISRLICGGSSSVFLSLLNHLWLPTHSESRPGDGVSFPRNPKSDELLARLAKELVQMNNNA